MVPRPFAGEAFGGWFGRIAARYQMNVDDLALAGDLHFDFGDDCCNWLVIPSLTIADRNRLAFLSGVHEEILPTPYAGRCTPQIERHLPFCPKCLWLNPLDIAAPFWKAEWPGLNEKMCPVHGCEFDQITGQELTKCRNMRRLLTYIEKRCRKRRLAECYPRLR